MKTIWHFKHSMPRVKKLKNSKKTVAHWGQNLMGRRFKLTEYSAWLRETILYEGYLCHVDQKS